MARRLSCEHRGGFTSIRVGNDEESKDHGCMLRLCETRPEAGVKADVTLRVIGHAGGAVGSPRSGRRYGNLLWF